MKKPFVTVQQLEDIAARYPTPFHLYDEQGIRENARRLKAAFSWNPGYREYFAVKATPTPAILKILQEEGCGCDCSSLTELMMAGRIGCTGEHIMFSSNETPAEDYRLAAKLGATINLDDITHVDFLEKTIGYIPKRIGCRFNPGGTFSLGESREGFQVMDNPGDAKYGMTRAQITEAFRMLKAKGAEEFGIHAFLASNTLSNAYYPALARILFQLAVELQQETGCHITYINLSGGVGIPYRPEEPENDIAVIGVGNSAMDCARTAIRNGARHVTCYARRDEDCISASEHEVRYAKLEGVGFRFCKAPVEIRENGLICRDTVKNEEGKFVQVEGSETFYPHTGVIVSVSQGSESNLVKTTTGIETNQKGLLTVSEDGSTTREGVFAGGDAVMGARTVVEAVAIAKQVAESMDKYMKSLPADTTPDPYADIPTFQTPTSDVLGKQEVK